MGKVKKTGKRRAKSILSVVFAVLLVVMLVGTGVANHWSVAINTYLSTSNYKVNHGDSSENTDYFKTAYEDEQALADYEKEICQQVEAEGAVLLMNNGALPLASGNQVSLFSHSSVAPVYGGTGSGAVKVTDETPTLLTSLESNSIGVNKALWDFYDTGTGSGTPAAGGWGGQAKVDATGYYRENPDMHAGGAFALNEVPWDVIQAEPGLADTFTTYGDAAVMMISRVGGEGYDLAATPESRTGVKDEGVTNYLELAPDEQEIMSQLKALKDKGVFDKIIVLINTSNAIELDFLNPEICGTDYGIDAALWIGGPGQEGMQSVGDILAGKINPSGKLVDIYCNDNLTSPVMQNMSLDTHYPNGEDFGLDKSQDAYSVYEEGIYVGYRYYETRYEDTVMGTGNTSGYNYASDVAYPFGYGSSYTSFDWSNFKKTENEDSFDFSVTVKNTGDMAGKEVVEMFFQSPYTDYDKSNSIEKASVELCGYAKTSELAPGASETVTINVPKQELRAYDAYGAKTYILDEGDYYFTAGRDSHDAVNNILAAKGYTQENGMDADGQASMASKWHNGALDTTTYAVSSVTGNPITNQFDNADPNLYMAPDTVTYVSRSDWKETFPKGVAELVVDDQLAHDLGINYEPNTSDYTMPKFGEKTGMSLAQMIGLPYDDPSWETLLDSINFDDMSRMVGVTAHQTPAIPSIAKPETKDENGPTGLNQTFFGGKLQAMAYPSAVVMASTFNDDLVQKVGECIGEDGLHTGTSGLYGPATNTHRSPYSGRNYEYYSEDPFNAGKICAAFIRGVQSKGMYTYLKHFALNDYETNREGGSTWTNEQAAREIYLQPFETAVVEGGTNAIMTGLQRIGAIWTGAHNGLCNVVLRSEWGFDGFTLTDYDAGNSFDRGFTSRYMHVATALINGTDSYDAWQDARQKELQDYRDNPEIMSHMRQAAHRILYVVANSAAMNGISKTTTVSYVLTWWQMALIALDVLFAALAVIFGVLAYKERKQGAE